MMPQSPSKQVPWDLTQFSQSPSAAPSYFPESHWQFEIPSLSKVILVLGKARSLRVPNLGCRGVESPGWFDDLPQTAQDMLHECVRYHDEAANHQLPIAAAFWIIGIVSMEECSSLSKIWCIFIALLAQSFWTRWPHRTQAHSTVSTASVD